MSKACFRIGDGLGLSRLVFALADTPFFLSYVMQITMALIYIFIGLMIPLSDLKTFVLIPFISTLELGSKHL